MHGGHSRGVPCLFFFQAEDGIRDKLVTGVQTCALPILLAIAAVFLFACDQGGGGAGGGGGTVIVGMRSDFGGFNPVTSSGQYDIELMNYARSEERRVGKECRARWTP